MRLLVHIVLTLIIPNYISDVSTDNIFESYGEYDNILNKVSEIDSDQFQFRRVFIPYSYAWGWRTGLSRSKENHRIRKPYRMASWGWSPPTARIDTDYDDDDDGDDEEGWGWEPKYGKCNRGSKKKPAKKKELKKGTYIPQPPPIHNCGPGQKGPDDERGWKRAVRKKERQKRRDYRKAMSWKRGAANAGWVPIDYGWPGYKGWKPRWYNWYETNLEIWD